VYSQERKVGATKHDMIGPEFETHDCAILNSYHGDPVRRMLHK